MRGGTGGFEAYRRSGDRQLRDQLVLEHDSIAQRCARRFADRGEPYADLIQVARLGLMKAVERFDPTFGSSFVSFATPTVLGELRHHFRDSSWTVGVPRQVKDLIQRINSATDVLTQDLGRNPSVTEIADLLGVPERSVTEGLEARRSYRTSSLDRHRPDSPLPHDRWGADDPGFEQAELQTCTRAAVGGLDELARSAIVWRFYEGCSRDEIAERLDLNQVQVTRLLRNAIAQLKSRLVGMVDTRPAASVAATQP